MPDLSHMVFPLNLFIMQEKDIDSDYEWQQLIELSDQGPVNTSILQRLKTKLLSAKNQVSFC